MSSPSPPLDEQASREKRLAALGSIGSAVVLVTLKVFLAVLTGSLGILRPVLGAATINLNSVR
jgi:hypothetical protein